MGVVLVVTSTVWAGERRWRPTVNNGCSVGCNIYCVGRGEKMEANSEQCVLFWL